MKEIQSHITQFRGSHYQLGKKQGEKIKNSSLFSIHQEQLQPRKRPKFTVDTGKAERLLKQVAPGLWDEVEGLAEGLGVSVRQAVTLYSGFQQEWVRSGCSILTTDLFMIRNYDYHPKTYEGRFMVFQPNSGYATIGPSQRIIGRTDGMNEKGLVVGYNFVNRRSGGDGFIPTVVTRILLETCSNNEEAISVIKQLPHRHSFNFVLYDKNANSHVIEASPRGVRVRKSSVSTNHFELMSEENRHHMSDSLRRLSILEEQSNKVLNAKQAFQLFNHKEQKVYSEAYSNWAGTLHTSLYHPGNLEIWFAIGGNKFPFAISFSDWLQGRNLPVSRFRGLLNTEEPLPLMEEGN